MNARISAVLFGSAFAGMALLTLLDAAAKGFALFAVAALVALALRRASAAARHVMWLSALVCALALPCCAWFLPQWRVLPMWMSWEEIPRRLAVVARPQSMTMPEIHPIIVFPPTADVSSASASSAPTAPAMSRIRVSARAVLLAWMGGAIFLIGPLLFSLASLRRVSARARVIRDGPLATALRELQFQLGLRREVRLLLGEAGAMPMVWGILRPHLLLPAEAAAWEPSRVRGVLLHELAHLRRRDPLSMLVAQLALAVHWFNPLAWFAVRQLRAEQERACDDCVLRHGIRASEYATDLLAAATGLRAMPFASAALSMAHPARLEGRIAGILDAARNRRALTRWLIAASALLAVAVALPLAMLRAADEKRTAAPKTTTGIVAAKVVGEQLQLDLAAGEATLIFRVGAEPDAPRFALRIPSGKARTLSADFTPGGAPLWERFQIRAANSESGRLPLLSAGFLPRGAWTWRESVARDDARFTFADVLTSDGGKTPVSVEAGETPDSRDVPFVTTGTQIECEFRIYDMPHGAPKEAATMKLADAERLIAGAGKPVSAPRVTTRSGQRAIIEVIREFRYETKPGEWETRNVGVTWDIEPESFVAGVDARGKISLVLFDGAYASLADAVAKVLPEEGKPFAPPLDARVRSLEKEFAGKLGDDTAMVVPLPSQGLFPGAAVALVTMKKLHFPPAKWRSRAERATAGIKFVGDGWLLKINRVTSTADAAEIAVDEREGSLAFVVGEGKEARVIVHECGRSQAPIAFRVSADDRGGKWWDQVRIVRAGESDALVPMLPDDWLPNGRVVFLPAPAKRDDGSFVIAEIESASGKTPLAVRGANSTEQNQAAERELPRTSPHTTIAIEAWIYAVKKNAPEKNTTLPVKAAQDLVGPPRGALGHPSLSVNSGRQTLWGLGMARSEKMKVSAIATPQGIRVEGSVTVPVLDGKHASVTEAFRRDVPDSESDASLKELTAEFSATLGRNDALVIPIASEGIFPETLVSCLTALPRPVPRDRWVPPSARSPVQFDGWVLTWPRAEHEWFTSLYDYKDGDPAKISHLLKHRKETSVKYVSSEWVGFMGDAEMKALLEKFRGHAGVKVDRVEPFSVSQHLTSFFSPKDRVPFSAAGERGSILVRTSGNSISPTWYWDSPILKHVSAGPSIGVKSGTCFSALLPGPAEPEEIRMMILRCVNPDAEPAR